MISFNYYQYKGCVRKDVPYFYPLNIFIYTMNWILDLPCIALLWLWMWNYPIDDPENGIQGDFYIGYILKWYPFCQVHLNLANYPHFQSDRISAWIVASCDRGTQNFCGDDSYLESYSRMTIPKMETWEVFSMHFRNYPLIDIDTIIDWKVGLLNYPHIQKVRIEKWLM